MHSLAEATALQSIFELNAVEAHFQPIVNITAGRIHGYEALSRGPTDSPLHSPYRMFTVAERHGRLSDLETLCRGIALSQFKQLALPGKLFINISPKALLDPEHLKGQTLRMAHQLGYDPTQIVIELSEQYPAEDIDLLKSCLDHYRNQGFLVALDDLGAGYSGLRLWSELAPDYVKIDRHFIDHIDQSPVKQEFVRSIVELCQSLTCNVIAEGIETDAELTILRRLGITLCQGFLLGCPCATPTTELQYQITHADPIQQPRFSETAECLCENCEVLPPDTRLKVLSQHFMQNPSLQAVAVIDEQRALGLVYRQSLLELFSTPYGRALNESHPITDIMDSDVLMVEATEPLSKVSFELTADDNRYIAQQFIILRAGKFLGVGHTRDLLQRITEQRIQTARHANPLTELPGNVPIQQELQRLSKTSTPFYLAYFDLNNFKPYNDVYGFAKGDDVIRATANLLRRMGQMHFIGHVGGDDFVMIALEPSIIDTCLNVLTEFENIKQPFFQLQHWHEQQFRAKDRQGNECNHPLISLSVGVLSPEFTRGATEEQLSTLSARAKKQAKLTCGGFCLFHPQQTQELQIA